MGEREAIEGTLTISNREGGGLEARVALHDVGDDRRGAPGAK